MNVFMHTTTEPCPICLEYYHNNEISREMVMPLPKYPPTLWTGEKCCSDCNSAQTLIRLQGLTHIMNRLAVGNERMTSHRLPLELNQQIGLTSHGVMKVSGEDDFDGHITWLNEVLPYD